MTLLDHQRYCDEILAQTGLLRQHLTGADLSVKVPTCPEWTLRELAVHVGGAHRWVHRIVSTASLKSVPPEDVPHLTGPGSDDPAALDDWLAEGADMAVEELRAAGPDMPVWTWGWDRTTGFWSRRMTHETLIHRADAALTTRQPFTAAPEIAADALDEWLEIVQYVQRRRPEGKSGELRGGGRSLHLHATDAVPGHAAEWTIELTDDGIAWHHSHTKATVALRGPLTEVLRVFYRRLPVDEAPVEVLGEREVLEFWLERASFG